MFATQKILSRLLNEAPHKFLVLRKVGATIKNSVFALFKDIIVSENLQNLFLINKSDFTITCKINGNQVIFSGLDDSEKIKSIAGITGVWLEEASEFTFDEWSQIQLRVRGQHKHYVQFMLTFNPISEESWLKTEIWDKEDDGVYKLVTTYKDNCFLSKEDVKHFEERVKKNAQYWRVYGCGLWGTIQTGGEMVHQFDYNKHVANVHYNPKLPLHISVDFNVLPHCSMAIFQIDNGVNINIIDEIALEHPKNRTKDMCQEFCRLYANHAAGVFVYGDVAGQHSDTRSEAGHNDYTIIMRELIKFKPQLRLGTKAPSVVMSTSFLNSIFDNNEKIKLIIDFSCKKIINDMLYLKQNSEGGKLIEYEKHPQTGTRYEKYGHFFDVIRYYITTCFDREYIEFQSGAKPFAKLRMGTRIVAKNGY